MVSGKESGFGEGVRLFADSRISIPDSLLGKRGSVRVGSALLSRKADSPLPFPDSGIVLRGIGGLTFPDSSFINQVSGGKVAPHRGSCTGMGGGVKV